MVGVAAATLAPTGRQELDADDRSLLPTQRRCLVTRTIHAKTELLRFVRDGDQQVLVDFDQRLPGRGAYLLPDQAIVQEAVQKRLFARAFKGMALVPADLLQQVQRIAAARLLGRLGLLKRSGELVLGAEKVSARLLGDAQPKAARLYLYARDAAENGREKLLAKARATATPALAFANMQQLSEHLGAANLAHMAVLAEKPAKALASGIIRLDRLLGANAAAAEAFWAGFGELSPPHTGTADGDSRGQQSQSNKQSNNQPSAPAGQAG